MASGFTSTGEPFLLAKPLDVDAGGYYHRGKELYKEGDVFVTMDDPGYKLPADWVAGGTAAPTCQPTTEVGP
ncbi:MAG: hypothetical protein E6J90_50635 [Deltaproteobacteria bacterium]|nr:MAG: hypothetical protein E6J90_50635 [Deltaproteobacteria bacterium]TMQ15324.1 MAG: hypothetical protein E6J91_13535 [Deltaproteobacteria bacterium]